MSGNLIKILNCKFKHVLLRQLTSLSSKSPLLKIISHRVVELPSPAALRSMWNFGSLLGLCLVVQLARGIFIAIHYSCDVTLAFESVNHLGRDVNLGWALRIVHANGARFFFICLYWHLLRGVYYGSYNYTHTWIVGVTLLFLVMGTAFLGYVLPWGQISFWGATVITNLASAIPYIGQDIVTWLWGGFAVGNASLTRFFALHFLLPFIVSAFSIVHLFFLHETGSRNPLGVRRDSDKVPFNPYFTVKDALGFLVMLFALVFIVLQHPWDLGDPENFIAANPLVTPLHIQPEWYFLYAYAILRSIPNKVGGVIALVAAIAIFYIMPFYGNFSRKRAIFRPIYKLGFWTLVGIIVLLTWIGARPVEEPYILTGQLLTVAYFRFFLLLPLKLK